MNNIIWQPINLALGLTVAMFLIGVIYDWRGHRTARLLMPLLLIVGAAFYALTLIIPGSFAVFIIYEAIAMIFALAIYLWLAFSKRLKGAWLMTAGITITILASVIQASRAVFITLICEFDHNGIFHITQMIGLTVLFFGLRAGLLSHKQGGASGQH